VTLLTVGHGTLSSDALASLLHEARVDVLVDIRSFPGSRRNPQFGRDQMEHWVPEAGIEYRWEPRLGGRRRGRPDSRNTALTHAAFRAYADHMETAEFATARAELLAGAAERRTAVMCSESVWWRCHRRLLSDAVVLLDHSDVLHLFHDGRLEGHHPMDVARVDDGHLVYDAGQPPLPGAAPG
jgi:uncharacterized protein (DUF488 family)